MISNLNCNSQNWLDKSKNEIIQKLNKNKNIHNIVIKKDTITYDLYINNELYSKEERYFRKDTCYRYISSTNILNYEIELKVLTELFGIPIIGNNWTYPIANNYRIVSIEIIDDKSVTTMTSYSDYNEYINAIHFILNPTEYD